MRARELLNRLAPLLGLAGVYLFFLVAVWIHTGRNSYGTAVVLQTILQQSAIVGMAALGMTMVIVAGGIDLSVGSAVALASCVIAALLKHAGWPALPAALGGIAAGAVCGLLNGVLITGLRVVPFIVTLSMFLVLRGLAKGIADNKTINPGESGLNTLLDQTGFLPTGVWILAGFALAVALLLRYTRFGRHLFAIGSNEAAARLCGVPIARTKILVYAAGGFFSGMAGLFQYSRLTIGDPTTAQSLELETIAAVVIGGGSLSGGVGSVAGSLVGALVMTTIKSGCSQMGWASYVTEIVAGAIILAAVALDRLRHRGSS